MLCISENGIDKGREEMNDSFTIRNAVFEDAEEITEVEARCFPEAEAAGRESFEMRLKTYPDCFWLMCRDGRIVSFINGMPTNDRDLKDEMYHGNDSYVKDGQWLMIFGVDTLPEYRHSYLASRVMEKVIEDTRVVGRKGIVLTCKDELLKFYERFGFVNEGVSPSVHGGATWYQMRLTFTHNFFAAISRMKYIKRWNLMRNSRGEALSEHSMEVAMIAHALCVIGNVRYGKSLNAERAAVIGLYHDASEIITGDMPTPVKYYNEEIKNAYKQVEAVTEYRLINKLPKDLRGAFEGIFKFSDEDPNEVYMRRLVKAADKLSALIKCIEEENAGNREFRTAKLSTEKILGQLSEELPEVKDFTNEFLPPYGKTLDELEH